MLVVPAEIEAAEEAGQAAKAEELRKAKRAEIIRKLRSLRRSAASPAKKKPSTARGAAAKGGSHSAGSSSGGGEGDKPAGRAVVEEADVARIISAWTGRASAGAACTFQGQVCLVQRLGCPVFMPEGSHLNMAYAPCVISAWKCMCQVCLIFAYPSVWVHLKVLMI